MNKNLFGISGEMMSGKDTVGFIINALLTGLNNDEIIHTIENKSKFFDSCIKYEWEIKKFAGILKQIASLITGYSLNELEQSSVKNTKLGWHRWVLYKSEKLIKVFETEDDALNYVKENNIQDYVLSYDDLTVRDILIYVGTEGGREIIHPDIWILSLFKDFSINSKWIITDVRFFNEANKIKNSNGINIRVEREVEGRTNTNHSSENQLNRYNFPWDYVIDNNDSLEVLIKEVRRILVKEKLL